MKSIRLFVYRPRAQASPHNETLEPARRISVIANDNKLFVRDRLANRHVLCVLFFCSSELKRRERKKPIKSYHFHGKRTMNLKIKQKQNKRDT